MKLSAKPRLIYMIDPNYGKPYPYAFAGLGNTMRAMGLEVFELNPATATLESFRKDIESFKPELLFGFVQDRRQLSQIAGFLKEYHPVPAINWYDEDPNGVVSDSDEDPECVLKASACFDMWFGIDNKMVPFWRTKAAFMPPAFDEAIYHNDGLERCFDISYVGQLGPSYVTKMYWPYMKELTRYGKKAMLCIDRPMGPPLLPRALEHNLRSKKRRRFLQKLPFWRCAWENPKNENEKALIINRSKIHFGLNRVRGKWEETLKALLPDYPLDEHGLFYQLKMRPFQAVGTGALALNEYCPELEDLFEIDKEIVTFEYGNIEELRNKLDWYISNDAQREQIAKAGYQRGRKQHTFSARIQQIFDAGRKTFKFLSEFLILLP
ncbi:MAG: glycosyltransferase family protein [Planctomycetota bacterium]